MNLGLTAKVALVGGASKGIGKGCALSLAREGTKVAICARNSKNLKETAEFIHKTTGSEVLAVPADLGEPSGVKKSVSLTLERFGKIDILLVNSGGPPPGRFFDLMEDDWNRAYYSVLYYVIDLYHLVIPQMKKNRWGRIINITSMSVKEPVENLVLSNVFRSGVVSLAKTISKELIGSGITINNICPGSFKTNRAIELMKKQAKEKGVTVDQIEKQMIAGLPLGKMQSPEEIGNFVSYLASNLAGGITGTTIQIDGGISRATY